AESASHIDLFRHLDVEADPDNSDIWKFEKGRLRSVGLYVGEHPSVFRRRSREWIGDRALFGVVTAGDDKVCRRCQDLADEGPFTMPEVIGLLPAHINCRCAYYPWTDMRYRGDRMQTND